MAWLSQTDVENYGTDLIDVVQRGALNAVAPHLQNLADQNDLLRQRLAVEARHRLDSQVAAAVPNFREIDADPRWHNWLLGTDSLSGRMRQTLLDEAISQAHPSRVIRFFQEFQNQATHQGAGQTRSWAPRSGQTYTRAQIQALYSAHRRGAYTGREAAWQEQERDIIAAGREGRILGGTDVHGK